MATRHQVVAPQQQPRVPVGKQKAAAPRPDGKNRRPLQEIGNNVLNNIRIVEGKPQLQDQPINRPITSFGAMLLAKAQAQIAVADKKKPLVIPVDRVVPKPATKRLPAKPNTDDVIEITSDPSSKKKASSSASSVRKSTRKDINTLTSVLEARSKAACGITEKPKELIDEIDALNVNDQLAVVDYVDDIYKFYKSAEHAHRPRDYMSSQVEISARMRSILVDWLIEVHQRFELMPETLYLTMFVVDSYLSMQPIPRRELQLVGICSMLIACKYEEIWAPEVNDFITISDRAYTREQILGTEKAILNKLQWNLTVPTPYVFIVRFVKAAASDKEMEHMIFFYSELALMNYSTMIKYCPSMVAASAVLAARATLNKTPLWTPTLKRHTGFSEQQLLECAQTLVDSHSTAPESKLKVVYKKYSAEDFKAVSMRLPATNVIKELKSASNK